jgi:hypothetical protein
VIEVSDIRERRAALKDRAQRQGLRILTWAPGDGVTRYRFRAESDRAGYFGQDDGLGTAFGLREAEAWLDGYIAARRAVWWGTEVSR